MEKALEKAKGANGDQEISAPLSPCYAFNVLQRTEICQLSVNQPTTKSNIDYVNYF